MPPEKPPESQSGSTAAKGVPGKPAVNLLLMAIRFPGMALPQKWRIRKAKDWEWPACNGSRKDCR
jgi:hypothetical protein